MVGTITVQKSTNQDLLRIRYQSIAGCDSVIVLDLTINSSYSAADTTVLTACDSTVWGGTNLYNKWNVQRHISKCSGCDSIITLDLTIVSPVTNNVFYDMLGDSALLAGSYQTVK